MVTAMWTYNGERQATRKEWRIDDAIDDETACNDDNC
jgi:hypothetical protein